MVFYNFEIDIIIINVTTVSLYSFITYVYEKKKTNTLIHNFNSMSYHGVT